MDFEVADHSISYRVLSSQDKPRVGIRPNPVPEMVAALLPAPEAGARVIEGST